MLLDRIADRWYGAKADDPDATNTRMQVSRGVHRLGYKRGYRDAIVAVFVGYVFLHLLGVA